MVILPEANGEHRLTGFTDLSRTKYLRKTKARKVTSKSYICPVDGIYPVLRLMHQFGEPIEGIENLREYLQNCYNTEKDKWPKYGTASGNSTPTKATAYAIFHLCDTAPRAIVDAVWKHLAKTHHPDCGGDPAMFRKYKAAYDIITGREVVSKEAS